MSRLPLPDGTLVVFDVQFDAATDSIVIAAKTSVNK